MKILFLDIDGVMNCRTTAPQSCRTHTFDPEPTRLLKEILQTTGAQVVISSSWRINESLSTLRGVFRRHGLDHCLIRGVTPHLGRNDQNMRGLEIGMWLDAHAPRGLVFAIVDDGDDMGVLRSRLVQTEYHVGLTRADADHLIALLSE